MQALRISVPRTLALLALVLLIQDKVQAETAQYETYLASYSERLATLEAELASLRAGGGGKDAGCSDCGAVDCCCGPTYFVSFEVPYMQDNDGGILIPGTPIMTPHYGQEYSYRIGGGRELCKGIGARTRLFDFEDRAGSASLGTRLDLYAVDLEFTHRGQFCGWNTLMAGGVRIAGMEQSVDLSVGPDTIDIARDFDGAGLTFAVEFERTCWWRCLGLYGGFRGSLLYGDADIDLTVSGPGVMLALSSVATIPNQTIAVWETQLGLQIEREMRLGTLVSRVGVEAQLWEQPPVVLGLLDDNIGLFGPTFSVGIER